MITGGEKVAISLPSHTRETKRDTFRRLAEKRTNAVIERLRVLGNLSNPHAYEYTEDDVRAMFSAIEREVRVTKLKFEDRRKREFRLT
jgi:hypothetical protein